MHDLFTIGHSTHDLDHFLDLLKKHQIQAIADVRSFPSSSRSPHFSQSSLKSALKNAGINYVFLGQELGARRDEPSCYEGNRADYNLISESPLFKKGMKRLEKGVGSMRIALMSSKQEPLDCHRAILLARHAKLFATVQHIHADGSLESHTEAETRLLDRYKLDHNDLFQNPSDQLITAYQKRGLEINYLK